MNIFNGLKRSRSIDHVIKIAKFIEFDSLDSTNSVVGAKAISCHLYTIALSAGIVNTAHHSVRCLVLNMKIKILYFDFIIINFGALSPHEHQRKFSIEQIADERDLNVVWLSM